MNVYGFSYPIQVRLKYQIKPTLAEFYINRFKAI